MASKHRRRATDLVNDEMVHPVAGSSSASSCMSAGSPPFAVVSVSSAVGCTNWDKSIGFPRCNDQYHSTTRVEPLVTCQSACGLAHPQRFVSRTCHIGKWRELIAWAGDAELEACRRRVGLSGTSRCATRAMNLRLTLPTFTSSQPCHGSRTRRY